MTVGEQLKRFRLLLGLSQKEMAAGIVTASFYSRVERGKNEIVIDKLVKILNAHGISFYDFFEVFDEENLPNLNLEKRLHSYFDNRDINKLIELKKAVKDKNSLLYLKINLIISDFKSSGACKQCIDKKSVLKDIDTKTDFWDLAMIASLYSFDQLKKIISSILKRQSSLDLHNTQIVIPLMDLLIRYLNRCYKEQHLMEAKEVENFVNTIPNTFAILFHKLIVKYYMALFNQDYRLAGKIIKLIDQSGYRHYIETLPQGKKL